MHSLLVGLAYMAIVFAPCAAAQWGDVLMKPWFGSKFLEALFASSPTRRNLSLDPLLARMQGHAEAAEIGSLGSFAFTSPVHLPPFRRAAPATFAETMNRRPKSTETLRIATAKAAVQVAARLAQMVEAHRQVNSFVMEQDLAPVAANVFAAPPLTMVNALHAYDSKPVPTALVRFFADFGTTLHLLPALVGAGGSPPRVEQSPPAAVAA